LYQYLVQQHRPLSVYEGAPNGTPSPQNVAAVRDWIEGLNEPAQCPGGGGITQANTIANMQRWLRRFSAEDAKRVRFVTLAPSHTACASDREMAGYGQAVQKLLNSLSRGGDVAPVDVVGDDLALLAFDIGTLGWEARHWELLARSHPKGSAAPVPADVRQATG